MKQTFRLVGLDCANCAAKIEAGIQKISGVTNASVDFMTTKMVLEGADDQMDSIVAAAHAIVKKVEPDVVIKRG